MSDVTTYTEKTIIHGYECDIYQRWKPSAVFQSLTEAAQRHAELLGVGYRKLANRGLCFVLARLKIRFHAFPRFDDSVTIRTWPRGYQQRLFFMRDFELLDAAGDLLASATSAWLVISLDDRRLVTPAQANFNFAHLEERRALDEKLALLKGLAEGEERLRVTAGYSTLDLVGHVTNSRYVDWICDALPLELFRTRRLAWLQVNYDHEVRPGEQVAVLAAPLAEDGTVWQVSGLNRTTAGRAFEAQVGWSGSSDL